MKKLFVIFTAAVIMLTCVMGSFAYAENNESDIMPISGTESSKIPLFSQMASQLKIIETSIEIPVYSIYGYLAPGYYLSLYLPSDMPGNNSECEAEVSVTAGNDTYQIKPFTDPAGYSGGDTYENKITFGYLPHGYNPISDDTVLPISTAYNDYSVITVVIRRYVSTSYDISNEAVLFAEGGDYAATASMHLFRVDDGSSVLPESSSFGENWKVTSAECEQTSFDFVTASATENVTEYNPLIWDHTFQAINNVNNADLVKVVVKLSEPIVGAATYTLIIDTPLEDPDLWWHYNLQYVEPIATESVDGSCNELVFTITSEQIQDAYSKASTLNFIILENIALFNTSIMTDFMHVDLEKVNGINPPEGLWLGWVSGDDRAYYNGEPINYAHGGEAGAYGASVKAVEAYMELTVSDPVLVNLSALMRDNLQSVRSYLQGALPDLRIDEVSNSESINFNVYGNNGQTSSPEVTFNVCTNPGDFCTSISAYSDKGDLSFLKNHPEVCLIDGIPLAITYEELGQRLSNSNVDYYGSNTYSYEGDEQIPAYKSASYSIYKYFSNGDYTFMSYEFSQLRYANGQYVLLSDEEYAASEPVSVFTWYADYSRLPDLSYIEDLSLIGKTPEEAQSILDSLCPGLKYKVSSDIYGDYFTVLCDSSTSNVISCNMKDGVISYVYMFTYNPPKNLEGMPSVINQQKLEEMLADKNLSSRVVKNEYDNVVQCCEFYMDGKTYMYFEDGRAFVYPEYKGVYNLIVKKSDYIPGDVNSDGDVTLNDAILALQKAMNVKTDSAVFIEQAADINGDGEINLDDAIEILKIAMKVEQ